MLLRDSFRKNATTKSAERKLPIENNMGTSQQTIVVNDAALKTDATLGLCLLVFQERACLQP